MARPSDGLPAVLAADIGGTTTRVALVDGGQVTSRTEFATPKAGGPEALTGVLAAALAEMRPLASAGPALPVGVACTGQVWPGGRVRAVNTATMPGWSDFPLQDELGRRLGVPVRVINDAKAATLAEWQAAGRPAHFMFVTVSTGIGSGIVMDGRLLGLSGTPDRGLGFVKTPGGAWLEDVCSGTALGRLARASGLPSARELFDAAENGDAGARDRLEAPLQLLAAQLEHAQTLLGLEQVVLGGSVGLRTWLQERLAALLPGLQIRPAVHGADAGLLGAALFGGQAL